MPMFMQTHAHVAHVQHPTHASSGVSFNHRAEIRTIPSLGGAVMDFKLLAF